MNALKERLYLLQAIDKLEFDFYGETVDSDLPKQIGAMFENSGKRFRPALCFLMGQVFGLGEESLRPYARAVEMTHTASLIHDDVMDNSSERRKAQTINAQSGNTLAVLAGDFLLAKVIGELSKEANLEMISDLTDSIKDLADGEWIQHKLKTKTNTTWDELSLVARKKTGSLMIWSCVTPAKLAQQPSDVIDSCRRIGDKIGLIFQMLDDVNDFNPNSGKPFSLDLQNGLLNFVTSRMIEKNPELTYPLLQYKVGLEFPWQEDLKLAIEAVTTRTTELEQSLKHDFQTIVGQQTALTDGQKKAYNELFGEMLAKLRTSFIPK